MSLKGRNTAIYALIGIRAIFENRITAYVTAGRLVIPHNLPYALVVKIRNIRGEEINDPTQAQRRMLPVGPPMVRDYREPPRGDQYPMGGNTVGIYPQEVITETRLGKKLLGHYHQAIVKYCLGDPREQETEHQMCRGKYKTTRCRNILTPKGCFKGANVCPFIHPEDIELDIERRTDEVRQRIFKQMSRDHYALPPCIRLEIGEITKDDYDEITRRQWEHDQLVQDKRDRDLRTARSRSPRSRHGSSPARSNPRTPTPDNSNDNSGKGKGKGTGPTPAESMAAAIATHDDALGGDDSR